MMCSTRRLLTLLALGLLMAGCTDVRAPLPAKLSAVPIIEDDAMALRQWEPVTSYYGNGASTAYPIYFNYTPRRDVPPGENLVTGPVIFVAQTATMPLAMILTPPWEEVTCRGVYTPPTYTAVPATPNDATWYEDVKYKMPEPRQR